MQVFSIILKGEPNRGDQISMALEEAGCNGITISHFYLSDPKTYRVMVSFLDDVRVDMNSIKAKLQNLGFNVVSIAPP